MTDLQDVAKARDALAEVDAAIRRSPSAALEERRAKMLDVLNLARSKVSGDPSAAFPVLLLPVRLETRFAWQSPADAGRHTFVRPAIPMATPVLLVRIYPDDVHVDAHDPALTDDETAWQREFDKRADLGRDRSDFVAAWEQLVARVGPTRAAWIVRTRPPAQPATGSTLARPARAALLPDAFLAQVEIAGVITRVAGSLVREPLDLTPDPLRSVDGIAWMTDFDEAVRAGLGIVVPLPATDGRPPTVDRLVVVGRDGTRDPSSSATALQDLLDAHHYTDGLAFIRPGAATNATPSERTDRTSAPDIDDLFSVEGDMSPLTAATTLVDAPPADGLEAAALLGLDPAVFGHVAGADGRCRQGGRDLRRLIGSAFLDPMARLVAPLVSADDAAAAADFYAESVDCLGPAPVLRVGDQPYGLLPISVLDPGHLDLSDFERRLLGTLQQLRDTLWLPSARGGSRIGGAPADPTRTLLDLLRQDGAISDLSLRPVLGPEAGTAYRSTLDRRVAKSFSLQRARVGALLASLSGTRGRPPIGDLVFTEALAVTAPFVGDSPGDYLDELSLYPPLRNTLLDLASTALPDGSAVLHAIARLALLAAADRSCRDILLAHGVVDPATAAAWDRELDDGTASLYALADRLNTSLPADPSSPLHALLTGTAPPLGSGPFLLAREAIRSLAVPPAGGSGRPHRHPPPLLDTLLRTELGGVSHRLDAWFTGLATARLLRARSIDETGLAIGAYGVLLDLTPAEQPTQVDPRELPDDQRGEVFRNTSGGGYVHTPGVAQAITAGVLRSAHLAQWRLDPGGARDAFSVDLSSKRVRDALDLMDGIREGQPLAALLGYRIERRLRTTAPAGVAVVRRAAPLVAGRLVQGGPAEQVAADGVVDALTLVDLIGRPTTTSAQAALGASRGGVTDADWPGVLDAVVAAVQDARDCLDAVADVLVAEGVFQLVQGNPTRAGGSVDAIAAAGSPPPTPAVVDTSRGGTAVVHRVLVALPVGTSPRDDPAGWALSPRAALEPSLESWARTCLPRPGSLVSLRLSALDVVAATPGDLIARVTAAGLPPANLDDLFEAAAPLRELLHHSRPLLPADLSAPGATLIATEDVGDAGRRLDKFADAMTAARDLLDAALAAPADASSLTTALLAADLVGSTQPVPAGDDLAELVPAARTARSELVRRLAAHDPSAPVADRLAGLGGRGTWVLTAVTPPPGWPGAAPVGATPPEVERHIMRSATVRPAVSRLDQVLGVVEAVSGTVPVLSVIQQPVEAGERWVAIGGGPVKGGRLSTIVHLPFAPTASVAGLSVDEWTDVVPDPDVTTSIGFHYDAPSSAAPNVALLGVARPGVDGWSTDEMIAVVDQALVIAELRSVDPDALTGAGFLFPALLSRENPAPGVVAALDVPLMTEPR